MFWHVDVKFGVLSLTLLYGIQLLYSSLYFQVLNVLSFFISVWNKKFENFCVGKWIKIKNELISVCFSLKTISSIFTHFHRKISQHFCVKLSSGWRLLSVFINSRLIPSSYYLGIKYRVWGFPAEDIWLCPVNLTLDPCGMYSHFMWFFFLLFI